MRKDAIVELLRPIFHFLIPNFSMGIGFQDIYTNYNNKKMCTSNAFGLVFMCRIAEIRNMSAPCCPGEFRDVIKRHIYLSTLIQITADHLFCVKCRCQKFMMTSSNGNIFRVTGSLCGEFTGEFPAQRPVTQSFDVFLHLYLNKRLSKQSWSLWFKTPSC